jgi:hypothetical protein
MANGHGGRRPRAGRKPKLTTIVRAKALAEANEDAEYALGLLVAIVRDESLALEFREQVAEVVIDRVWGKAVQRQDTRGHLTLSVVEEIVDASHDPIASDAKGVSG